MIGRGEITKQAQRDGVDAQTVERDYILTHVAYDIAAIAGQRMILKGGTNLRLAHYRDYRYSADLDYSLVNITMSEALQLIADALDQCQQRTELTTLTLDIETAPPRINYVGPLAAKPRTVKLDLADDELVIEHRTLPLVVAWRDLPDSASIIGYSLNETCAEKLRCVIQRRQCRDVYDLWTLLDDRGGAEILNAWHIFERKATHKNIDPHAFFQRWERSVVWYHDRWDEELANYLGTDVIDFDTASRAIDKHLTKLREYLAR